MGDCGLDDVKGLTASGHRHRHDEHRRHAHGPLNDDTTSNARTFGAGIKAWPDASAVSGAAGTGLLHRRAPVRAIRAVHAAISGFRPEQSLALLAFVKPHAGIGGHRLFSPVPAHRTPDGRSQHDRSHHCTCRTWDGLATTRFGSILASGLLNNVVPGAATP